MKSILHQPSQWFTKLISLFNTNHKKSSGRAFARFLEENKNTKEELLDRLFLFSTAEIKKGKQQVVDFNLLLEKIQMRIQPLLNDLEISLTYNKLPNIQVHNASIEKVFEDLLTHSISNILQHEQIENAKIEIDCARIQSNLYQFSIKDNGVEIDPTQWSSAFHLFKESKENNVFDSAGLGLARAKRIIDTYGGEVQLFAEEGKGNCLIFTIQHTDEEGQQRPISDSTKTSSQRRQQTNKRSNYDQRQRG